MVSKSEEDDLVLQKRWGKNKAKNKIGFCIQFSVLGFH